MRPAFQLFGTENETEVKELACQLLQETRLLSTMYKLNNDMSHPVAKFGLALPTFKSVNICEISVRHCCNEACGPHVLRA